MSDPTISLAERQAADKRRETLAHELTVAIKDGDWTQVERKLAEHLRAFEDAAFEQGAREFAKFVIGRDGKEYVDRFLAERRKGG